MFYKATVIGVLTFRGLSAAINIPAQAITTFPIDDGSPVTRVTPSPSIALMADIRGSSVSLFGRGFALDPDEGTALADEMTKCNPWLASWMYYSADSEEGENMELEDRYWDWAVVAVLTDSTSPKMDKLPKKCMNEAIKEMGGPINAIDGGNMKKVLAEYR